MTTEIEIEIDKVDPDKEQTEIPFFTKVNVKEETDAILEFYKDYILADRELQPAITFFHDEEKVIRILARPIEDTPTLVEALTEVLMLWPALGSHNTMIASYMNKVMIAERGLTDALVISTVSRAGIYSEVYPFRVDGEEVKYDGDAQLEGQAELTEFQHMFAAFGYASDVPAAASDVVMWLSSCGHEIQFFDGWSLDTINAQIAH